MYVSVCLCLDGVSVSQRHRLYGVQPGGDGTVSDVCDMPAPRTAATCRLGGAEYTSVCV